MKHLVNMQDLSREEIYHILHVAKQFKGKTTLPHVNGMVANLFFEPSTRTRVSFEVAEKKLGLEVVEVNAAASSVQKGESLYDTIRTLQAIGVNAVVIRHPEEEFYASLIDTIDIPIINGGDGKGEHPSQCLLDLFTIYEEFGHFEGLQIVIAGDILHSRVARSNALTLSRLGADVRFSGPPSWQDERLPFPYTTMDEAVEDCDVLMLLRVQRERHEKEESHTDYLEQYGLTAARETRMHPKSIILHPAPVNRGVEIEGKLVECDRSRIFTQMENGVYVRMTILNHLLNKEGLDNEFSIKKRSIAGR
ncbi:aspartate carbamoyltransferase catalytic subunit [Pontibacillus salicampi]|uniref:Aspartate carbamoyltransferase n=1 Tax=Pontibacillus salicampi TaxID=1449801 RepID=A0ABV6LP91_9BACI